MKTQSQNAQILQALQAGERLTSWDITMRYRCLRPGARISDIREMGYPVSTTMHYEGGKRWGEYEMEV